MVSNQVSANPYEAPLEPQLPFDQSNLGATESTGHWPAIRDCLILSLSISSSGAILGMGLGAFFGLGPAIFGGLIGFTIAFIPTVAMVVLCRVAVPAFLRATSKKRTHYVTGITSGALSGIISVLVPMASSFDEGTLVLAGGAALIGGLGGLVGSHWSGRWYRESWSHA